MIDQIGMPEHVTAQAFRAFNGEYAWRRADLVSVLGDLAARGYAVLCGEVWVVEGSLFSSLSPRKDGGWAVLSWEVPQPEYGEDWRDFAQRSAQETQNAIYDLNPEECVAPEAQAKLYYHLLIADEANYSLWHALPSVNTTHYSYS